jgi:2-phosphosulfolactate phosphatase
MRKIHLLLKKEEIDEQKISENKVAVIFDILLATSTIASALEFGAKQVIPVLDGTEATHMASKMSGEDCVLVGEYQGKTIDGFLSPNPLELRDKLKDKTVILSTTNGTVAIKRSSQAKTVYAASILNSQSVVDHLFEHHQNDETIVLVCAGSSGEFNVEDFYGAGYFIDCLFKNTTSELELTDSAFAAHQFFKGNNKNEKILRQSRIGTKLAKYGFDKEIEFVSQGSILTNVPILVDHTHIHCATKMTKKDNILIRMEIAPKES